MISEDYCSYEVAKLLKEKGFDEPCIRHWDCDDHSLYGANDIPISNSELQANEYNGFSAPSQSMAMKWLREEKHIIFVFKPATFSGEECTYWTYEIWAGDNFEGEVMSFKTYEQAVEAALKYSLENLI